jgi:hypothetical protein
METPGSSGMNKLTTRVNAVPLGVKIQPFQNNLERFKAPDCAALIMQRSIPNKTVKWLTELPVDNLPSGRVTAAVDELSYVIEQICSIAKMPRCAERSWLEEDILDLAERFADVMGARYLRLRLDVISTNACRKFHRDAVTARLICTYRGSATQIGNASNGRDPKIIKQIPSGTPILLRGTLWPEHSYSHLVHRSPPIEGTGENRLLLVIDTAESPHEPI